MTRNHGSRRFHFSILWAIAALLGAGLLAMGRVFKIGNQSINARLQAYRSLERPDGAPKWSIQAQLTFLFPK